MSQFAVLDDNNMVRDIIVADDLATANEVTGKTCVPCDPLLGVTVNYNEWAWDAKAKQFVDLRPTEPEVTA